MIEKTVYKCKDRCKMKSPGSEAVKINNNIMGAKTILIRVRATLQTTIMIRQSRLFYKN